VLEDHKAFGQAFGARGAHVVLPQHFQHGGAGVAAPGGQVEEHQHAGRQRQVLQTIDDGGPLLAGQLGMRAPKRQDAPEGLDDIALAAGRAHPAGGEPPQRHRKDRHRHQASPKRGHGLAKKGQRGDQIVDDGVLVDGRVDANWHGDDNGDNQRYTHQQHGVPQAPADQAEHWFPVGNRPRFTPIPLRHLAQPAQIAALVEAAWFLNLADLWAVLARKERLVQIEQGV